MESQTRRAFLSTALCLCAVPSLGTPTGSDPDFTRAAEAAVERIEHEDGFSGVILVARGNQVLLRKSAGLADRQRGIRNTPETPCALESVTKQFTAAAIMLLVEEGKVALDDPISKYYAASPHAWDKVTIRHLLTHSSGVEDYWVHRHVSMEESGFLAVSKTRDDIVRLVLDDTLGFEPGKGFSYSNAGYVLLADVIEKVSGRSYGEFLQDRIFVPAGMHDTRNGPPVGDSVWGYIASPSGAWQDGHVLDQTLVAGAGGIYSTVDDMLKWSIALETERVLSKASKSAMYTDYGYNYGFGWRFAPKFGRKLIWHTGNDQGGGFAAIFDRFPEERLTVVVMTNNTGTLTNTSATLLIEGKVTTFPANAARKLVEEVERFYFGRAP